MNKETFLNSTLSNISQVYLGKRDQCRCGCGGTYTLTSYMINSRSENTNDKLVEKRLKRAKRLVEQGVEVNYGSTYVDVKIGDNKTLTFYFDDLKNK